LVDLLWCGRNVAVAITYKQFNATGKRKEKEKQNLLLMTGNHGRFRFSE